MREPSLSLAVNDIRLVLQLYWQATGAQLRENEVRTSALSSSAVGYLNSGDRVPSVFGFSYGEVPSKNSYSAAYSLAQEYNEESCVTVIDFFYRKQQYYWVCGVKDGAVVIDGDKVTKDEEYAKKLFFGLKTYLEDQALNDEKVVLFCPAEWSVAHSSVKQLQEIEVHAGARIIRTQTLWERYRAPLGVAASCLIVLFLADLGWGKYQAFVKEREAAEKAAREKKEQSIERRKQEEADRMNRIRLSKPWLQAPTPEQFIGRCLDDLNRVLIVPGWTITEFKCAKTGEKVSASEVSYTREPYGERREIRLAFSTISDASLSLQANSDDARVSWQSAPYPDLERRLDIEPLYRVDVESYLSDAFEPFGGAVDFTDRSDTKGQSEPMMTAEGKRVGVYQFEVSTVLQPEQFVGLLNRIPTLLVLSMNTKPLTDNHWRVSGQVYFQE